jgi:hypothetical protein
MDKYDKERRTLGVIALGGAWGILGALCSLTIAKVYSLGEQPSPILWFGLAISVIIVFSLFNDYLRIAGFVVCLLIVTTGLLFFITGAVLEIGGSKAEWWLYAFDLACISLLHAAMYVLTLAGSQSAKNLWQKISPHFKLES